MMDSGLYVTDKHYDWSHTDLTNAWKLLSYQFVHVAVKHDVDVTLQADPDVVQLVCESQSRDAHYEGLIHRTALDGFARLRKMTDYINTHGTSHK